MTKKSIRSLIELPSKIIDVLNRIINSRKLKRLTNTKELLQFYTSCHHYYQAEEELRNSTILQINDRYNPIKDSVFNNDRYHISKFCETCLSMIEICLLFSWKLPNTAHQVFIDEPSPELTLENSKIQRLLSNIYYDKSSPSYKLLKERGTERLSDVLNSTDELIQEHEDGMQPDHHRVMITLKDMRNQLLLRINKLVLITIKHFK